jgi:hypothetical protein
MSEPTDSEKAPETANSPKAAIPTDAVTSAATEVPDPMLEVHAPHESIHTWKSFFVHIATIVIGLLIAVGLEQAVETIHWHKQVRTARDVLRQELLEANRFYEFRVAVNECVAQRLAQLNNIVESAAEHANLEPVGDLSLHIGHLLTDDAWQSERAAQTLVHFSAAERESYGTIYGQQIDIRNWLIQELSVWAAIRLLQGNPGRLSTSDITLIRQNLQIARTLNFLIVVNATQQLSRASELGLPKVDARAEEVRETCAPLKRTAPSRPYTTY